ncbi:MAG: helix-turn-helix transcriptional regulator [Nitrospira sp.]
MVGKDLSMREHAVLALLRRGQSNKEMSVVLGISTRTVQTYLRRIYWHLGVQTRAEAIVALYERSSHSTDTWRRQLIFDGVRYSPYAI